MDTPSESVGCPLDAYRCLTVERFGSTRGLRRRIVEQQEWFAGSLRETLHRLALAAELRDPHLGGHAERVGRYTSLLAQAVGMGLTDCEAMRAASSLHDVGKIGIPDQILQKPGSLTAAERAAIERHTVIGHAMLAESGDPLLDLAASIALHHHEHVDGHGYPQALVRDEIPLEARIVAITDTFDALTCSRVYRPARSLSEALDILDAGADTHFDPELLDCFMAVMPEVTAILDTTPASTLTTSSR